MSRARDPRVDSEEAMLQVCRLYFVPAPVHLSPRWTVKFSDMRGDEVNYIGIQRIFYGKFEHFLREFQQGYHNLYKRRKLFTLSFDLNLW